mmetsp:Transcript_34558/g.78290  ORF Transcript_34558/g.78290 Transcript_34558/m.78290 type:complete len:261 (+) Transcript_34558:1782-2564(+)
MATRSAAVPSIELSNAAPPSSSRWQHVGEPAIARGVRAASCARATNASKEGSAMAAASAAAAPSSSATATSAPSTATNGKPWARARMNAAMSSEWSARSPARRAPVAPEVSTMGNAGGATPSRRAPTAASAPVAPSSCSSISRALACSAERCSPAVAIALSSRRGAKRISASGSFASSSASPAAWSRSVMSGTALDDDAIAFFQRAAAIGFFMMAFLHRLSAVLGAFVNWIASSRLAASSGSSRKPFSASFLLQADRISR